MRSAAAGPFPGHLVAGLGNPGPRYAATRHNLGFRVVDRLVERWGAGPWEDACRSMVCEGTVGGAPVLLAKPQTYMNRSGQAVQALLSRTRAAPGRILVVHDDLDLPLGTLRVREGGGHGGHNGIRSILEALGTGEFPRLKLGIGRPPSREEVVDYVLAPFAAAEEVVLSDLLERAADAVESVVLEGPGRAMNRFHT